LSEENISLFPSNQLIQELQQAPQDWIERLKEKALECSDDGVLVLLGKLNSEQQELAITLTKRANNFQFDQIVELIQKISDF